MISPHDAYMFVICCYYCCCSCSFSYVFSLSQQALSDQELNNLSLLAMRRRMKLGDLEDDEEPPRKENTPGIDTGMFFSRIERVEHQVFFPSTDRTALFVRLALNAFYVVSCLDNIHKSRCGANAR